MRAEIDQQTDANNILYFQHEIGQYGVFFSVFIPLVGLRYCWEQLCFLRNCSILL